MSKKKAHAKNIIVTGGAGFIGSNLIRILLSETNYNLFNIDNLCFPGSQHTIADFSGHPRYLFQQLDITNFSAINTAIQNFKPSAIFHLAAESHVDRSIDNPSTFINTNVTGTLNLLESFRRYYQTCNTEQQGKLRFIHVSTDEVYGSLKPNEPAFTETNTYKPNSPYSASKAASNHLVRAWHKTYNLPLITTHCSNNYGPYQFPEKLIPLVIAKALANETIPVYGDGNNIRDWLHVEDHTKALYSVLTKGIPGETYNIGGDNEITNLEVVQNICAQLDELTSAQTPHNNLIQFVTDRPGHDYRYAINSSKIQTQLNWSPTVNFDEGLRKTVRWYMDNLTWCKKVTSGFYSGNRLGLGAE